VNLTSYAELAVRLVNSAYQADGVPDPLGTVADFGELVNDRPQLVRAATPFDLDALRGLRADLSQVFTAAATGQEHEAAERLNALLARTPIQPELVIHDDQRWHVHLAGGGLTADRYAAGAVIGLTLIVAQFGLRRLGVCSIASCHRVYIDASPNRSRRYCVEHCGTRANVTTICAQARLEDLGHAATAAS
jgi:predicted RNA-binding Zn ribbon-like protein